MSAFIRALEKEGADRNVASQIWNELTPLDRGLVLLASEWKEGTDLAYEYCLTSMVKEAARQGYTGLLDWLYPSAKTSRSFFHPMQHAPWNKVSEIIGIRGTVEGLEWIKKKFPLYFQKMYELVAYSGNIKALEWLEKEGVEMVTSLNTACRVAAANGHLEALKWLVNKGFRLRTDSFDAACSGGKLDIVKWIYEESVFLDRDVISINIRDTYIEDSNPFLNAIWSGSIPLLEYLWSLKPFNGGYMKVCESVKNVTEVLDWLEKKGVEYIDSHLFIAMEKAILSENLSSLLWLKSRIVDREKWNKTLLDEMWKKWIREHLDVLRFKHEQ